MHRQLWGNLFQSPRCPASFARKCQWDHPLQVGRMQVNRLLITSPRLSFTDSFRESQSALDPCHSTSGYLLTTASELNQSLPKVFGGDFWA